MQMNMAMPQQQSALRQDSFEEEEAQLEALMND